MWVFNTDAALYVLETPEKILLATERGVGMAVPGCFPSESLNLPPFVISVDSLLGTEVEDTLKRLAIHLTTS